MGEGFHSARLTIHVLPAHESFSIYCFGCFLDTGLEISLPKAYPLMSRRMSAPDKSDREALFALIRWLPVCSVARRAYVGVCRAINSYARAYV